MKLTELEKAKKLYERLQELDAEVIEIERTAQAIAEKRTEIKLTLKINDLDKGGEPEKVLDADGSLFNPEQFRTYFSFFERGREPEKEEYSLKHEVQISDTVALQVLGVLLAEKMEARRLALKALYKMGIDI